MKFVKIIAVVAIAAASLSFGACASKKPAPMPASTGYTK
jgi:hypothetical protein